MKDWVGLGVNYIYRDRLPVQRQSPIQAEATWWRLNRQSNQRLRDDCKSNVLIVTLSTRRMRWRCQTRVKWHSSAVYVAQPRPVFVACAVLSYMETPRNLRPAVQYQHLPWSRVLSVFVATASRNIIYNTTTLKVCCISRHWSCSCVSVHVYRPL